MRCSGWLIIVQVITPLHNQRFLYEAHRQNDMCPEIRICYASIILFFFVNLRLMHMQTTNLIYHWKDVSPPTMSNKIKKKNKIKKTGPREEAQNKFTHRTEICFSNKKYKSLAGGDPDMTNKFLSTTDSTKSKFIHGHIFWMMKKKKWNSIYIYYVKVAEQKRAESAVCLPGWRKNKQIDMENSFILFVSFFFGFSGASHAFDNLLHLIFLIQLLCGLVWEEPSFWSGFKIPFWPLVHIQTLQINLLKNRNEFSRNEGWWRFYIKSKKWI